MLPGTDSDLVISTTPTDDVGLGNEASRSKFSTFDSALRKSANVRVDEDNTESMTHSVFPEPTNQESSQDSIIISNNKTEQHMFGFLVKQQALKSLISEQDGLADSFTSPGRIATAQPRNDSMITSEERPRRHSVSFSALPEVRYFEVQSPAIELKEVTRAPVQSTDFPADDFKSLLQGFSERKQQVLLPKPATAPVVIPMVLPPTAPRSGFAMPVSMHMSMPFAIPPPSLAINIGVKDMQSEASSPAFESTSSSDTEMATSPQLSPPYVSRIE